MPDTKTELENDPTEGAERKPDVIHKRRPGNIRDYSVDGNRLTFQTENDFELRITVHTAEILQFKYLAEADLPADFSYSIDPEFQPGKADFEIEETDREFQLVTDSLRCHISRKKMRLTFFDHEGNILCEEKEPFLRRSTLMKGVTDVKVTHKAPKGTSYFGLGDKTCELGLRGNTYENWNTDSFAYERGDDPLYRTIPFYTALHQGRAYGIFMDNTYRSHFDFDSGGTGTTSFSADGGCMNYYFIYGPELTDVSERYTRMTGTPELPAMWTLGYHQCRWSYFPESRVRELAETFREKEIPCDAIYLDIDYMDDYRVFTWDKDRFPDPKKLISDLKDDGFETIVMIDPGIKVDKDYEVYRQGVENDYLCKRPDGELMIGPVWPPETVFPDFTHPEVRQWWADLYEDLMDEKGVSGVWNDMNEPAVFEVDKKTFPENIRHHFEGQPASHKKVHNVYGMQMARASLEGIKKHNSGKRPFLLTRANYSGGQRYAALWTGDNIASWDHLRLANEQCQRLSISGYSFVGSDIGGFVKNPSAELFSRWLQLGVFHPLFRNHTMGYNVDGAAAVKEEAVELKKMMTDTDQEPWTFGEKYTDINRATIELRYRLLHYLYTAFQQYVEEGTPILRPLAYYDQSDQQAVSRVDEFLFGDQILVSPVLDKKKRKVETYFPEGRWYDFRTNQSYQGKSTHSVKAPLSEIPFFVKAGSVLPLREIMQYTRQRPQEKLELNAYYGNTVSTSRLYEDAGEGHAYKEGAYRHSSFELDPGAGDRLLTLKVDREGSYTPDYQQLTVNFVGLPEQPSAIEVDGQQISFENHDSVCSITVKAGFQKITVR